MERPARDWLVDIEVAVPNLDIKAAVRVGAGPGLEVDCRALAAEVGKRNQIAAGALLTLWERTEHHTTPRPTDCREYSKGCHPWQRSMRGDGRFPTSLYDWATPVVLFMQE